MVKNFEVVFYTPISCSDRSTKLCQLENGILALLVSDPADSFASCSLTVGSGSHNDPDEIPGLAHLCEHVILASGSKKYPIGNHYHELIAQNGGSHNAYTTGENTTFYFELPATTDQGELVFEKTLDVFVSSFQSPIFTDQVINKEIYAIESEHNVNKASVSKQMYHATRLLAQRNHPFSRFCTGNFETLTSLPALHKLSVKSSLAAYFKNCYRASNMTICIRCSQSLNFLTKIAVKYFGGAIGGSGPTQRPTLPRSPSSRFQTAKNDSHLPNFKLAKREWAPKYGDKEIFTSSTNLITINSTKSPIMRLVFPVSHNSTRLSSSTLVHLSHVWCEVFGEESVGSLAHCLKAQNLITSITSSVSHFATGEDGLILELSLTQRGWQSVDTILRTLFDKYIPEFIHDQTEGIAQYLSDINAIELLKFLYQSTEVSPMELCAEYSTRMLLDMEALNPECLLKGSPLLECNKIESPIGEFAESSRSKTWWIGQAIIFQNFVSDFVNRHNLRLIMFGDQSSSTWLKSKSTFLNSDVNYEFDYYKAAIDMFSIDGPDETVATYSYNIPRYGPFLPSAGKNLGLIKKALKASSFRAQEAALSLLAKSELMQSAPRLVNKNARCEMWVKEEEFDLSFRSKTMVSFEVISKSVRGSPSNTMHLEILGQLLGTSLSSDLYPAEKIGYTYEMSPSSKGDVRMGFTITGFPEGVNALIKLIVLRLKSLASGDCITPAAFRQARVAVRTSYENAASENCTTLATLGLLIMLEECMWSVEDRLEALEEIEALSFRAFCGSFFEGLIYLNLFIQGDLVFSDSVYNFLLSGLTGDCKLGPECLVQEPTTKVLEPGTNVFIKHQGSPDDPNNSIVYFIQTGDRDDTRIYTLTSLTEYILSVTLVPDLRIKKQVGYAIFGGLRLLSTTVGIHITCMSGSPPEHLESQIGEYLSYMELHLLATMTENNFQEIYLKKFRRMCQCGSGDKLQKTAGPADVMGQIEANVQSGNLSEQGASMRLHKRIKHQISTRRYNFDVEAEPLDENMLKSLTLKQYVRFFCEKISIYSTKRSKISIMVESVMSTEEVSKKRLYLQVESYLKLKGLRISRQELSNIVNASQGRHQRLLKELLKYFVAKGETLKVCNLALREVCKTLVSAMTTNGGSGRSQTLVLMNEKVTNAIPMVEITDVNQYRRHR
ncbi:LAME_0H17656g1_1 [Lachancea meyersii CBS 8951]|uniref:LAME_0H17656g1_1 n=1 Tax=Lachancea meyersii CBS 8951 TaxID=1266667 RepID=A0A1G4KIN0_9SACH|nr:LAME_0H17656g1_1 [Lachancea meyersii CBS 8951]